MPSAIRPASAFDEDLASPEQGMTHLLLRNAKVRERRRRRLEGIAACLMPRAVVPCELVDGTARALVGPPPSRVRIRIVDRPALKHLLLGTDPVLAMVLAYARGAIDVEGDILEAVALRRNMAPPSFAGRIRLAWRLLRW